MSAAGRTGAVLISLFLATGCSSEAPRQPPAARPNLGVPAWSQDAIWYQIFVERFQGPTRVDKPRQRRYLRIVAPII
jgi:hypothetical protein